MTARLLLEYDGSDFGGWATQPGVRTVQATVEDALATVLRHEVRLTVAGRTDRGVHARGQVASHEGDPAPRRNLNALLPPDVSALASEPAPDGFDARRDARSRTYRYRLHTRSAPSPFEQGRALWWPRPLDREALDACAAALLGTHDFTAFTPSETDHVRFERDVFRAEWVQESDDVWRSGSRRTPSCATWSACSWGRCSRGWAPIASRSCSRAALARMRGRRRRRTVFTWRASHTLERVSMRVLLTNDDGITATGLNAMRRALLELQDVDLEVIAPDSNRSATGRAVTLRDPIWVEEVEFGDGTTGFATDGTPVDCVRFAALGLTDAAPELIVSGINHGANLGDDITYSGTVAAALEGIMLGIPALAVSLSGGRDFEPLARFVARIVDELDDVPMPTGTLLNVNGPDGEVRGARACRLGKRIYNDEMLLTEEEGGRRRYRLYGQEPGYEHEEGTDFAAIAEGLIAVTPLHFDLTDQAGVEELAGFDLERLLRPATEAVE